MNVGVDIGTGSVRSYTEGFTKTHSISTVKHDGNVVTQSSSEIYDAILKVLPEADQIRGICFTATCSMVVRQKVTIEGADYLKPFNCGLSDDTAQDVILWMDSRAHKQCDKLNNDESILDMKKTVGKFIPELGIPKIAWLSDNHDEELYCFELYDWFSYVFQVGYSGSLVPFKLHDYDYTKGNGIDGSIKGWESLTFLKPNIKVAKSESISQTPPALLYLGDIVGKVHPSLLPHCTIYNGCIDCYAGWVSTITDLPQSVSLVAGTSTCFIFESSNQDSGPIPGVWGPFQLIKSRSVYSGGQPATGKLFEELFAEFNQISDPFKYVELLTAQIEEKYGKTITELIKNYHYYGDKYGNRSPHMNFNMNECYIDGKNSSELNASVFEKSDIAMVIRYNLIIEFICFQVYDILQSLPYLSITVSGSQTKNQRLLKVLSIVTGRDIYVIEGDHSLNVARGAMQLCSGIKPNDNYRKIAFAVKSREKEILSTKKKFVKDLVAIQKKFTESLDGLSYRA